MTLSGRGVVVTGGGRGIGAAVARALAHEGASVVVAARSADQIEGVARELRDAGTQAWGTVCDVTDEQSVATLAEAALEHLGRIDVLVNSAGVARSSPVRTLTLDDWNRHLAVNATGTFLCTRAFLSGMVARGWGRIVNVASVAGITGDRYVAAYSASKHAVMGFTRSLAAEVAGQGVTVNAVCPGYVDTEMTNETVRRIQETTDMTEDQALEAILQTTTQHRLIDPSEVAHVVITLCHDDSKSVNGQGIVIDGGTLRV